jgi:5-methyltetrahydropteroyltriglutamate--homocysteine methyltransferase
MTLPPLPTTVIGSYSMPAWLERAKNDYLQRKVSRHDLEDMYDAARKAAIKDQEIAGVDVVSDGELQRDNMIDYFAERLPGVSVDLGSKRLYWRPGRWGSPRRYSSSRATRRTRPRYPSRDRTRW